MTKTQMIKDIQLAEARAWKHYRDMDAAAGRDSSITVDMITRSRTQWSTLYDLREALGIPSMPVPQMRVLNLMPITSMLVA
jgi:hypothetical protein